MRYLLLIMVLGLVGCASKNQGLAIKLIRGNKVDELIYTSPETLESNLKKTTKNDLDYEVEKKLIPPGGVLLLKNSESKNSILFPSDFTYSMLISSVVLESGKVRYTCEDAEIKETYARDNGVYSLGGSLHVGPESSHQSNKTIINCPINKAMEIPFLVKIIGFKGDTTGVYSVQKRE